jgi:UDP-2,4-diacetamido-2,4,6-trideoxy-beta-L-altropyranose hydrolase
MVIDDLADRPHECAVLLDQNLGRSSSDYATLVPQDCKVLAGVQYAMLRPEFALMRSHSLARRQRPELGKILVTMGGVDKDNATTSVLEALAECPLPLECHIIVLMGPHAPWLDVVRAKAAAMPRKTEVLVNVTNVAELMAESDFSIGAAGSTSWERCALGLPTFMLTLALNQREAAAALSRTGAVEAFELGPNFKPELVSAIFRLLDDPQHLSHMAQSSANVCDGDGVRRVSSALLDQ